MPPPPGVLPDPSDNLRVQNMTCHIVCLTLVTLAITTRIYTRKFITNTLGFDDALLVLSFGFSITFSALIMRSYDFGIGRHIWDMELSQLKDGLHMYTVAAWIYLLLGTSYRIAILAVYLRIFSIDRGARITIYIGSFTILVVNTVVLFFVVYNCNPPSKAWDFIKPGSCVDARPWAYTTGGLNVVEDLFVLVFPLPMVWGLRMQLARKLRLLAVFGFAILSLVASIIRLVKTKHLVSNLDTTRNFAEIGFWAIIEVNVAIFCAALTVIPAFLERHWPQFASIFNSTSSIVGSATANSRRQLQESRSKPSSRLRDVDNTINTSNERLTAPRPTLGHITVTHDVEMDFMNNHSQLVKSGNQGNRSLSRY
ncbi:hypothetical protein CC80DRAFT_434643 [Byssothecium circinans]|uniref:Rhodopsin domain-containing protein n=1 Tax=Byssothecium circinans TaxID=147558 RepID=A0A6A5UJR0_9PLEO|nr:hypothetical protein CC80DRAFT_434643 [Byssothecium circinans]